MPLFSTKDMRWLIYDSFRASYRLQLCYILTWHDITEILMASPWAECKYGHQIHVPIIHHILDPVWRWEMYLWTFCRGEMFPSASSKQRITSCKRTHCPAGLKFTDIYALRVTLLQSLQLHHTLLTLVFCVRMESGQNQNPCPGHVSCNLYLVSTKHVYMHVSKQLCNSDSPFRICVASIPCLYQTCLYACLQTTV